MDKTALVLITAALILEIDRAEESWEEFWKTRPTGIPEPAKEALGAMFKAGWKAAVGQIAADMNDALADAIGEQAVVPEGVIAYDPDEGTVTV